jgi:MYXO-CTERM domain-containing protein
MVKNPFVGQNGSTAKYLMLHALTGKDPADVLKPELKPSAYVSIMPMMNPVSTPAPAPGTPNVLQVGANASGGGQNAGAQAGDPDVANQMPTASASTGTFSSGCSMSGAHESATGGLFFLLAGLGLVVLARRRRA